MSMLQMQFNSIDLTYYVVLWHLIILATVIMMLCQNYG